MDDINAFIAGMFECYPREQPTPMRIKMYTMALQGRDVPDLEKMLLKHMSDPDAGKYMPTISDFVRQESGTKKANAVAAWHKITTAVREIGPYQTFTVDDPWAMQTLEECGGFSRLCEMTEKELDIKFHEFKNLYESNRGKGVPQNFPGKVLGIVDKENGTHSDPILIGNPERAQRVLSQGKASRSLEITRPELFNTCIKKIGSDESDIDK